MSSVRFGQYYNTDSIIHKIDPRVKIISVIIFMVAIFLVPNNNFYLLISLFIFTLLCIILTKVPLIKYLKSIKQIIVLLVFTFIFQILFRTDGTKLFSYELHFTYVNIIIVISIGLLFFILYRYLKFRLLIFLGLLVLSIYLFGLPISGKIINNNQIFVNIYKEGLIVASFIILRILTLIMFSNILTLTTKPMDLNNAIESLLSPLEKIKIRTSLFAMMISIALRFIPTLFNEMDKILKAQASRGSDFNEGNIKQKIKQIISILVPMFIISFKRADDLATAMEARGYIPYKKRTKLNILKMHIYDYFLLVFFIMLLIGLILLRIYI